MSNQVSDGPDCTDRCRSSQHGILIANAISKRGILDPHLCAFLNYACSCCESVKDASGRTALHMAASCGRLQLARWLVQCRHANINAKDDESGYTSLHRSLFYGKIDLAVELIKLGANTTLLDLDNLTPLEHVMKDSLKPDPHIQDGELYVWGPNTNNCLGPQQARDHPELLDVFHKEHPNECVNLMHVEKFHSVIVTGSGKVFTCGHGQGGRLGLGVESTVVTPKLLVFPENNQEVLTCVDASIARDHSVFLLSDGNIYTCGLNTHKVLGLVPPPDQLLKPKQMKHLSKEIKGVCSGRYHTVAWGPEAIYTWGLNGGQLGQKASNNGDPYVVSPRLVGMLNTSGTVIKLVAASNGATAVYTEKGDVYILHEFQCRKIASRQLNLVQISIIGGKLNTSLHKDLKDESNAELKVIALTNHGNLLLWQESDPQLCRCIFPLRVLIVKQVKINLNGILFTTRDGEAFQGVIKPRKKKTEAFGDKPKDKNTLQKFLDKELCIYIKLTKFPRIHRAFYIASDALGHNCCVIQAYPYKIFEFPNMAASEIEDHFRSLLLEAHETDSVHDVVFKVGNTRFPAHRYLVSQKSPYLEKLMSNEDETVILKDFHPDIFEQFLLYVYTGENELTKCGPCPVKLLKACKDTGKKLDEKIDDAKIDPSISAYEYYTKNKTDKSAQKECEEDMGHESDSTKNPVRLLHEMAKKLQCADLQKVLGCLDMDKGNIKYKTGKKIKSKLLKFDRQQHPAFHDVVIKCSDGKEIRAHKCVLAARLEYFNNMFSMRWQGNNTSTVTVPFPKNTTEALLEYVYTDTISSLANMETEHLFKVLILADQLFVTRLKQQCEQLLTNQLTIKNCVNLLTFADIYTAEHLKLCCIMFIAANIAPILELRLLDTVNAHLLRELSDMYFQENSQLWCRVITPYCAALSDEEIISISDCFPVDMDQEVEKHVTRSSQKRRSRAHKTSVSDSSSKQPQHINNDSLIQFPDVMEEATVSRGNQMCDRLNAIKLAQEQISDSPIELQFTNLRTSLPNNNSQNVSTSFEDFPELSSPPNSFSNSFCKSPHKPESFKHKTVKVSQKQRKRLSSEGLNSEQSKIPESPKNPWKIIPDVSSSIPLQRSKVNIEDIISAEKKEKENLVKMKSKLLIYTQMEDKAIVELHKFYNTENVVDEIITVERVIIGAIAAPRWVPRNK